MADFKTFRILLSGRVQGVGFRYFAEDRAEVFGIKGYVRNTGDNKVEIVCQGAQKSLDIFISEIRKGPAFAHVTDVFIEEITDSAEYGSFSISYY